ncbi:hypothetical protein C7212DRAFT_321895, partial [Tuber magnatum]
KKLVGGALATKSQRDRLDVTGGTKRRGKKRKTSIITITPFLVPASVFPAFVHP